MRDARGYPRERRCSGGRVSILNTPIVTGDTIHLMIEIENGGVGHCFGRTLSCTATAGAHEAGRGRHAPAPPARARPMRTWVTPPT